MLFYNTDSDILLLAIPGAIPDHFQAYHLGFDASMNAVPTSAVVIHQPDGSPKSISYVNSRCDCYPSCQLYHILPPTAQYQQCLVSCKTWTAVMMNSELSSLVAIRHVLALLCQQP